MVADPLELLRLFFLFCCLLLGERWVPRRCWGSCPLEVLLVSRLRFQDPSCQLVSGLVLLVVALQALHSHSRSCLTQHCQERLVVGVFFCGVQLTWLLSFFLGSFLLLFRLGPLVSFSSSWMFLQLSSCFLLASQLHAKKGKCAKTRTPPWFIRAGALGRRIFVLYASICRLMPTDG